jgi:uncharacterized protein YggE
MNNKDQAWKVGALVGMVLVLFLAVVTIKEFKSLAFVGRDNGVYNSISVNGKGEEVAIQDVATFSFGVTEKAKTVSEAQKNATDKINATLAVVRAGGVEDKDIKTVSYTINPSYEYSQGVCSQWSCPPGKSVLVGYEVSQMIEVKVRDIEKAGELLASIGSQEVENISGLSFAVDNADEIKAKARAKAIADAQSKAEKLAKDLGVKIVRITSYYDSSDNVYPMYGMGGDMMEAKAMSAAPIAPEVPAGEQKTIANVTITYEIR